MWSCMDNIWTDCGDLSTWNLVLVHLLLPLLHEAVVILVSMFCSVLSVLHTCYILVPHRKSCFECLHHVYFDPRSRTISLLVVCVNRNSS